MAGAWEFLSSPENRAILGWVGGGLCVALSGLWIVVRHFAGAPAAPTPRSGQAVSAQDRSIAAGRDVSIGGDLRIGDLALPRLAIGLAALGMVLLALAAVFGRGDTITNSVVTDGDITGATIQIGGPVPVPALPQ